MTPSLKRLSSPEQHLEETATYNTPITTITPSAGKSANWDKGLFTCVHVMWICSKQSKDQLINLHNQSQTTWPKQPAPNNMTHFTALQRRFSLLSSSLSFTSSNKPKASTWTLIPQTHSSLNSRAECLRRTAALHSGTWTPALAAMSPLRPHRTSLHQATNY